MPRHEKEGEAKDLKESDIFLATKGNKKDDSNSPQSNLSDDGSKSKNPIQKGGSRFHRRPHCIVIVVYLHVPVSHIDNQLVPLPTPGRLGPSRKISQEASTGIIYFPKCRQVLVNAIGESH
jgi:hypothetical protein